MGSSVASRIMQRGIERGEANTFVPAKRELRNQRAKVPAGCTLYLVYGGKLGRTETYTVWPAMDGSVEELRMIRRDCRKRRWRCTYYVAENNTINVR